jgi:hypothetical protein
LLLSCVEVPYVISSAIMAVSDPSILENVSQRLEYLLSRAQKIKTNASANSFLPVAEFSGEKGLPPLDVSPKVQAAAVEVVARRVFQLLVVSRKEAR